MKQETTLRTLLTCFFFTLFTTLTLQAQLVTQSNDGGGDGTLRAEISDTPAGGVVTFDPSITSVGLIGQIVITKDITITGNGLSNTLIDGNDASRIFYVISGVTLTINDLTLTNGADDDGGAIYVSGGALNLSNTAIENSLAFGSSGSGGAVFLDAGSDFSALNSSFSNNRANRAGGAIEDNSGDSTVLSIVGSSFMNNNAGVSPATAAPGNGGAIHITGAGDMTIATSDFSGNMAAREGGALWNGAGLMTVTATNVDGNMSYGGESHDGGAGIFNNGGDLTIESNSVIANNTGSGASASGGGILSLDGAVTITDSEIHMNMANRAGAGIEIIDGSLTITNSNLTGNSFVSASPGNGGALHVTGVATVNITGGTVNMNTADSEGGGLWNQVGSTMTVSGVEISGNTALGAAADNGGGGVFNNGGTLNIENGTMITSNSVTGASASGGGLLSTDGAVSILASSLNNNTANRAGGAIEIIDGELTMTNSSMNENSFTTPAPGNGGALHVTGVATVNITGGTVNMNTANSEGGGLWNQAGSTMTVSGVEISGNTALGAAADNGGGGIFNNGGDLIVNQSTMITDNTATGSAGSGGGIQNVTGGSVNVSASTISGNMAMRAGGGIEDNSTADAMGEIILVDVALSENMTGSAPGNGGGLHVTGPGDVMITGGMINDNTAANEGGGLWNGSGTMTIAGATIAGNVASGATIADPLDIKGGGGIFANDGGSLIINEGTTISGNFADGAGGSGGGILLATTSSLAINGTEGSPVVFDGNAANRAGGAIEDWSLDNSTSTIAFANFTGNSAGVDIDGFTASAAPGNGGAIHITGTGSMTISGGSAMNNLAAAEGGAFWNSIASMTIENVTVTGNTASGAAADNGGGGLFNNGGVMMVANSMISENMADGTSGSGGGILNVAGGSLTVTGSEISENMSMRAGGGIEDNSSTAGGSLSLINVDLMNNSTGSAPGNGGGLHITGGGNITITGGTISGNTASNEGGGLWNGSGVMTINGTMISGNIASGATIADPLEIKGGGGIFANDNGTLIINEGTMITGNFADGAGGSGGGVLMAVGSSLTINGTEESPVTFDGNAANRAGGAIEDWSLDSAVSMLTNVTFTGNSAGVSLDSFTATAAPGNGGAIHISGPGSMMITDGMATGNLAASEGGAFWNSTADMTIDGTQISGNIASGAAADNGGGGLFNNGGYLMVMNAMIADNTANGASGSGGGIQNVAGGMVDVLDSQIMNNMAMRAGGGIEDNSSIESGFITLTNTTVSGNATGAAPGNGGGFHITGPGDAAIVSSTFSGNTAVNEGGAIWNGAGSMSIIISTISGNSTDGDGGGLFNLNGELSVNASTIAMNTAAGTGGGVDNAANSPVTTFTNTIVAMNTAATGNDIGDGGTFTSADYNLIGIAGSSISAQANDIFGSVASPVDPLLGALADNGGVTLTHAPGNKSPVYNAGNPADTFVDQIGQDVFDGIRDIGSFEAQLSLGVDDFAIVGIKGSKLYPNPVMRGEFNINIPQSVSGQEIALKIYEVGTGKLVYNQQATSGVNNVNVNGLASGTYIVQLVHQDKVQNLKMVVGR